MISIDDIENLDKQNVYGSLLSLPDQCNHAWEEANKIVIPEDYKDYDTVIMCGMGGSGLGARVIDSFYSSSLKKPLIRINDYHIPAFTNERSIVFVSSYSGNTEETVQNLTEALERKSKVIVIGAGGKIIEIAKDKNIPFYLIDPKYNPSNQPRMAIGYSIIGELVLASKINLLDFNKNDLDNAVNTMKSNIDKNDISKLSDPESLNYSYKIKDNIVLYISSEHLIGAVHVVNNQLNENAKNLSYDFNLPELNHHLMEGLRHPELNKENIIVFIIESDLYSDRIKKRLEVTKEVVQKNDINLITFKAVSTDKFSQMFEIIQFGGFINFYLTMLYGIDPAPIPWVDYFKERLS